MPPKVNGKLRPADKKNPSPAKPKRDFPFPFYSSPPRSVELPSSLMISNLQLRP